MTNAIEIQQGGVGGEGLSGKADARTTVDGTVSLLVVLGGAFVILRFLAAIWRASRVRGRDSGNSG